MHIVIDARMGFGKGFGISRYVSNLIRSLARIDLQNHYTILVNEKQPGFEINNDNFKFYYANIKWLSFQEQLLLPLLLKKLNPDVFHATSFVAPFWQPCKTVVSILDLIHLSFPKDYSWLHRFYYWTIVRGAARKARRVITISEYSKREIERIFRIKGEKIRVIYIAASKEFYRLKEKDKASPQPYILTVGNQKSHKNMLTTIKAYERLKSHADFRHKLLIVGKISPEVKREIALSNLQSDIILEPCVSDAELNLIYNSADIFVFPSLCEGFGLPVLEAMACGIPVVTSNTSSLPEVVGEAGIMVDPKNADAIANAIKKVLSNQDLALSLSQKGLERAKLFSWEECARQTLEIYKIA